MKYGRKLTAFVLCLCVVSGLCCLPATAFANEKYDIEDLTFYLGDVDLDCKITAEDARFVLRISVGLEEYDEIIFYCADYIGDEKITAEDARFILRTSVGLEELRYAHEKPDKAPEPPEPVEPTEPPKPPAEPPKPPAEPTKEEKREKWLASFPEAVSYDDLESNMYWMVNDIGVRNWWSSSQNFAGNLIYDRLVSYGYPSSHCKKSDFYYGGTLGRNVMAVIPTAKTNPDIILVMAHYDTVRGTGGAVDNSSGTVALLQTAKIFKNLQRDFGVEIRFLFTSGEEQGYYGAYGYLNTISYGEKIRHKIVFNIDMAGKPNNSYSPGREYYLCVSTEPSSSSSYYAPAATTNMGSIAIDNAKKTLGNLGENAYYSPVRAGYHDIIPFRKAGIPSLTLSWRCYNPGSSNGADYGLAAPLLIHSSVDHMGNFDMMSLYNTTKLITLSLAHLTDGYIENY